LRCSWRNGQKVRRNERARSGHRPAPENRAKKGHDRATPGPGRGRILLPSRQAGRGHSIPERRLPPCP